MACPRTSPIELCMLSTGVKISRFQEKLLMGLLCFLTLIIGSVAIFVSVMLDRKVGVLAESLGPLASDNPAKQIELFACIACDLLFWAGVAVLAFVPVLIILLLGQSGHKLPCGQQLQ